jgi:hypothetical protein
MSEKKGVKELKEMIDLALAGVDVGIKASADGKVDVQDLSLLLSLIPLAGPAIDGVGEIPAELSDLSADEAAEVVAHIMAKLSLGNGKAIRVAEKALKAALAVYMLVQEVKAPEEVAAPVEAPAPEAAPQA